VQDFNDGRRAPINASIEAVEDLFDAESSQGSVSEEMRLNQRFDSAAHLGRRAGRTS
jgi:hypothetical protein